MNFVDDIFQRRIMVFRVEVTTMANVNKMFKIGSDPKSFSYSSRMEWIRRRDKQNSTSLVLPFLLFTPIILAAIASVYHLMTHN